MRNRRLIILLSFLGLFAESAQAISTKHGANTTEELIANRLNVQIGNHTKDICRLQSRDVIHTRGYLKSAIPVSIISGDTKSFEMIPSLVGPEITLSYRCGNRTVKFYSHLIVGVISPTVKGQVISEDPGIHISYSSSTGSYWLGNVPSFISWEIEDQ